MSNYKIDILIPEDGGLVPHLDHKHLWGRQKRFRTESYHKKIHFF
jgi:hypothetical protein